MSSHVTHIVAEVDSPAHTQVPVSALPSPWSLGTQPLCSCNVAHIVECSVT